MGATTHPLLIVGLDGASWTVLDQLIAEGTMPHLGRLAAEGARTELLSTLPVATLPAWTSFLTGLPPAAHGVTDIFLRPPGRYALVPATGAWRLAPTFLARLSRRGLRVISLGVPGTFPAERVRGLVVPGFDAPGVSAVRQRAVWPPSYWPTLARLGGWRFATFNQQAPARRRLPQLTRALLADLDNKEQVLLDALARHWQLLFVHLQATDTLLHHLWPAFDQRSPRGPLPDLAPAVREVFARIDRLLGRALAALPGGARVLLVSDHGMGGASNCVVHLNRFLAEHGWLHFSTGRRPGAVATKLETALLSLLPPSLVGAALRAAGPDRLGTALSRSRTAGIDISRSLAFSDELDYAPTIWMHRRRHFPSGLLDDAEADRLAAEIATTLTQLRDPQTGAPLIARVHQRAELPPGPAARRLPDLVIEPAWPTNYRPAFLPSYNPGPSVTELPADERLGGRGRGLPGVHRREGIFLAWGENLPATDWPVLDIAQAGLLVYPLLELPVPAELTAGLPSFADQLLPWESVVEPRSPSPATASPGELSQLARLRQLGYVD